MATDQYELYEQYKNINIFAIEWRKFKPNNTKFLDPETFRKNMQTNQYTKLDYMDNNGKPILIYLFTKESAYTSSSQKIKQLLSKIKDPSIVIFVTYQPLSQFSIKAIRTYKHIVAKNYLHENFACIIPNGPMCYPHQILTHKEINELINKELCCYLVNLSKIFVEDVQCIWIGAEIGDVLKITSYSDIAGEFISYRVVIPKKGNVISFRNETQAPQEATPNEELEDDGLLDEAKEEAAADVSEEEEAEESETE